MCTQKTVHFQYHKVQTVQGSKYGKCTIKYGTVGRPEFIIVSLVLLLKLTYKLISVW